MKKCPNCELNYIEEDQEACHVCMPPVITDREKRGSNNSDEKWWTDEYQRAALKVYLQGLTKKESDELARSIGIKEEKLGSFWMCRCNYEFLDTDGKAGLQGASKASKRVWENYKNPKVKLVVCDLGTGGYLKDYIGHEIFNLDRNSITGKFYGHCPPWGNLEIGNFGASQHETCIDGVLVVYTTKKKDSNDREIIAFCPSARAYRKNQSGEGLSRVITEKNGTTKVSDYAVESDMLIDLRNRANKFTIKVGGETAYIFRKLRFYGGTYPELDSKIIAYIQSILDNKELLDDDFGEEQAEIQRVEPLPPRELHGTADKPLDIVIGGMGQSVRKDMRVSKTALAQAEYKCQIDPSHETFTASHGMIYMEGHHLIPCTLSNAQAFKAKYNKNIDCVENIVCICPTCHRAVHFGNNATKMEKVRVIYAKQAEKLKGAGIPITEEELLELYKK